MGRDVTRNHFFWGGGGGDGNKIYLKNAYYSVVILKTIKIMKQKPTVLSKNVNETKRVMYSEYVSL